MHRLKKSVEVGQNLDTVAAVKILNTYVTAMAYFSIGINICT